VTEPLLIDRRRIVEEYGVTKAVAEYIMRHVRKVRIGRRVYVRRADVVAYLRENEYGG